MKHSFFTAIGKFVTKFYGLVLIVALILTIFLGYGIKNLTLDMTWLSMAPQKSPSVQQFKYIINKFNGAVPIIVAIQGQDTKALKTIASQMAQDLKSIKTIKEVHYKFDRNFLRKHGLKLQKAKDIKRMKTMISDFNLTAYYKNLNNDFEKEYIEESDESLSKQEKNAIQYIEGLKTLLLGYTSYLDTDNTKILNQAIDEFSFGPEYYLSSDKKMILLFVQPNVSIMNIQKIIPVVRSVEKVITKYKRQNKNLQIGQTGFSVVSRDEMDAGMHDTVVNLLTAIIAIFLLLSFSFRMWSSSFLAMTSLLIGVIWDIGLAYLFIGRLNLMTAMVGVILIGLGIDYSIHILTSYTQNKYSGLSTKESIITTYQKTGPGILTGALTTAIAFFVFMITKVDILKELGFVMGTGILATFSSTLFILPSLIIIKEKIFKSKKELKIVNMEYPFMGRLSNFAVKNSKWIIGITVLLFIGSLLIIPKLHFITDFKKMEARGLVSLKLMDVINEKLDLAPDPILLTATNLKETEEKTEKLLKFNSVGFVNSLSQYLPPKEKQKKRIKEIQTLKILLHHQSALQSVNKNGLLKEITRLKQNIIEMGDMSYMGGMDNLAKHCENMTGTNSVLFDNLISSIKKSSPAKLNLLQKKFANRTKFNFSAMLNSSYIKFQDIPKNIRNLLVSSDGKTYLINAYSSKPIWNDLLQAQFLKDVRSVDKNITGMAPIMETVIHSSGKGGKYATILAFLAIFILVLLDFRNLKYTLIALVPLILGSVFILGFLVVTNIYFTWMTVMIVPLIIGIGIDDGVHIIHRYRIEKRFNPNANVLSLVMKTTGKAVALTSFTTMIGFGSLVFSIMVGYEQFGLVLFVGIGLLLILSSILLPIILDIVDRRKK